MTFLRCACTPGRAIGIRPVPTWKSTAAAPTPASGGPYWVPCLVTMPSPFLPWQEAQPTRNSARPWSMVDWSAPLVAGERTAYRPPVTSRPISRTTRPASGLRRLAERRAERSRTGCPLFCPGSCPGRGRRAVLLLDEVDRGEQPDPDDIDEVPVVRHDDGTDRLLVGELAGHEGAAEDQQEGDQTAGHVEAVETGREVEDRAVGRARDRDVLLDERDVLGCLAGDEEGAHDVGEDEPLTQPPPAHLEDPAGAPDLAPLGREDAELAGQRRQHEHRRVDRREGHVELGGLL